MMFKRPNKSMVGVDIGSSSVKAVELQGKNGDFQLVSLGYEALEPDSVETVKRQPNHQPPACEFCNEPDCAQRDFSLWHKGFTASIEVTY